MNIKTIILCKTIDWGKWGNVLNKVVKSDLKQDLTKIDILKGAVSRISNQRKVRRR